VRAQDAAVGEQTIQLRIDDAASPLGDAPFGATIVLGLDSAKPAHGVFGSVKRGTRQVLIV
jgi:hypothetical protein